MRGRMRIEPTIGQISSGAGAVGVRYHHASAGIGAWVKTRQFRSGRTICREREKERSASSPVAIGGEGEHQHSYGPVGVSGTGGESEAIVLRPTWNSAWTLGTCCALWARQASVWCRAGALPLAGRFRSGLWSGVRGRSLSDVTLGAVLHAGGSGQWRSTAGPNGAATKRGFGKWGSTGRKHGRPEAGQGQDRLGQSVIGSQVKPGREPVGRGSRNNFSSHPRRRVSMFRRVGCSGIG